MKFAIKICCILTLLFGCKNKDALRSNKVNSTNSIEETQSAHLNKYPIEKIMSNSERRVSKYKLDFGFTDKTKLITAEFFKNYLDNYPVKNIKGFKIEFDEYSRYCFFDFVEFDFLPLAYQDLVHQLKELYTTTKRIVT